MSNDTQVLRATLDAALARIEDMLADDDGQAFKEARKFLESARQLAEQPGFVMVPVADLKRWKAAFSEEAAAYYPDVIHHVSASIDEIEAVLEARPLTASPSHTTTHVTDREPHPNAFMQVPAGAEVTAHWPALTASPTAPSTEASEPVGEREAFEAWYGQNFPEHSHPEVFSRNTAGNGEYWFSHVQSMRDAYEAGRALKGTP